MDPNTTQPDTQAIVEKAKQSAATFDQSIQAANDEISKALDVEQNGAKDLNEQKSQFENYISMVTNVSDIPQMLLQALKYLPSEAYLTHQFGDDAAAEKIKTRALIIKNLQDSADDSQNFLTNSLNQFKDLNGVKNDVLVYWKQLTIKNFDDDTVKAVLDKFIDLSATVKSLLTSQTDLSNSALYQSSTIIAKINDLGSGSEAINQIISDLKAQDGLLQIEKDTLKTAQDQIQGTINDLIQKEYDLQGSTQFLGLEKTRYQNLIDILTKQIDDATKQRDLQLAQAELLRNEEAAEKFAETKITELEQQIATKQTAQAGITFDVQNDYANQRQTLVSMLNNDQDQLVQCQDVFEMVTREDSDWFHSSKATYPVKVQDKSADRKKLQDDISSLTLQIQSLFDKEKAEKGIKTSQAQTEIDNMQKELDSYRQKVDKKIDVNAIKDNITNSYNETFANLDSTKKTYETSIDLGNSSVNSNNTDLDKNQKEQKDAQSSLDLEQKKYDLKVEPINAKIAELKKQAENTTKNMPVELNGLLAIQETIESTQSIKLTNSTGMKIIPAFVGTLLNNINRVLDSKRIIIDSKTLKSQSEIQAEIKDNIESFWAGDKLNDIIANDTPIMKTTNPKAAPLLDQLKEALQGDDFIFSNVYDIIDALKDQSNQALAQCNHALRLQLSGQLNIYVNDYIDQETKKRINFERFTLLKASIFPLFQSLQVIPSDLIMEGSILGNLNNATFKLITP